MRILIYIFGKIIVQIHNEKQKLHILIVFGQNFAYFKNFFLNLHILAIFLHINSINLNKIFIKIDLRTNKIIIIQQIEGN